MYCQGDFCFLSNQISYVKERNTFRMLLEIENCTVDQVVLITFYFH